MTALKGTKISDVSFVNAAFKPEAHCLGVLNNLDEVVAECNWSLSSNMWTQSRDIKKAAKDHAYFNPDHTVHVDQVNRTQYRLNSKDHKNG